MTNGTEHAGLFDGIHTPLVAAGAALSVSSLGGVVWTLHEGDIATGLGLLLFVVVGALFVGIGSEEQSS